MIASNSTRTHVAYQFIILTLLFISIGYNELLPDRNFMLFLAFAPIFCYQLIVLSCCLELIPVPSWMSFLQQENRTPTESSNDFQSSRSNSSDSVRTSSPIRSEKSLSFPDASEIPSPWQRQKSVINLGASAKVFTQSQKSKSWMSLNESKSAERLLSSREGSLDVLVPLANRKCTSSIIKQSERTSREERSKKAKSWKPGEGGFHSFNKAELAKSVTLSTKSSEQPSTSYITESEESEISKSFSFPFRHKRLETWLERKETPEGSNQSLDMPYWHSVGYSLAVKYEARRRKRVSDNLDKSNEESTPMVQKYQEILPDAALADRHHSKKCSKLAVARINKLKVGISNLISKKKDEVCESLSANSNKISRSSILLRLRNKNVSNSKKPINVPEFPQFLNDDRPQIFYPRYLPFEKERFENDVKNKMKELSEGQETRPNAGKNFPVLI